MNVQAEVSLYPLRSAELSEPVERFCQVLRDFNLRPETGKMSTLLCGELDHVFLALKRAVQEVGRDYQIVLAVKISNACPEDLASGQ